MANRKKHLKYQANKQPKLKADSSIQGNSTQKGHSTKRVDVVESTAKVTHKSKLMPKTTTKSKIIKAEIFSQLPDQEVDIVKLELRHILFTGSIILIMFLSLWLITHFTQLDELLYSSLHLIVQSK